MNRLLMGYEEIRHPRCARTYEHHKCLDHVMKFPIGSQQEARDTVLYECLAFGVWDHMDAEVQRCSELRGETIWRVSLMMHKKLSMIGGISGVLLSHMRRRRISKATRRSRVCKYGYHKNENLLTIANFSLFVHTFCDTHLLWLVFFSRHTYIHPWFSVHFP